MSSQGQNSSTKSNKCEAYSDALHIQVELVGQVAQGEGSAGPEGGDVHVGEHVALLRHHLQREAGSEAITTQAPPEAVHNGRALCQLVLGTLPLPCRKADKRCTHSLHLLIRIDQGCHLVVRLCERGVWNK